MKKVLVFIAAILLPLLCAAQETGKLIVLNNGTQFPCTVIEETPTTVTVQNEGGEKFTYNKVEVKMITDKPIPIPGSTKVPYTDYSSLKTGFWAGVDLSGGYGFKTNSGVKAFVPLEMDVIAGYRFNKYIQLGIGAGVRFYVGDHNIVYIKNNVVYQQGFGIPIFFNARGIMIDDQSRTTVPFWSVNIGYTTRNGFMFSPALGLRIGSLERHHFNVSIAYTLQQANIVTAAFLNLVDVNQAMLSSVSLRLGYQF